MYASASLIYTPTFPPHQPLYANALLLSIQFFPIQHRPRNTTEKTTHLSAITSCRNLYARSRTVCSAVAHAQSLTRGSGGSGRGGTWCTYVNRHHHEKDAGIGQGTGIRTEIELTIPLAERVPSQGPDHWQSSGDNATSTVQGDESRCTTF